MFSQRDAWQTVQARHGDSDQPANKRLVKLCCNGVFNARKRRTLACSASDAPNHGGEMA
jgi:hypothetical protein